MEARKVKNGMGMKPHSEDWEIRAEYRVIMELNESDPKMGAGLKVFYRPKGSRRYWGSFTVKLDGGQFPTEDKLIWWVEHAAEMRIIKYGTPTPLKKKRRKNETSRDPVR